MYIAFAAKADQEGHAQAAKLFRAAAEAETVHAHAHLRVLKGINGTAENLKEAIAGETHEFKTMYPEMIKLAEEEGHKAAARSFAYANEVEETHAELYQKAIDTMENPDECAYYICSVCGHTHENEAPEKCPVCNANQNAFYETEGDNGDENCENNPII